MPQRTLIAAEVDSEQRLADLRELCQAYASYFQEPIALAIITDGSLEALNQAAKQGTDVGLEVVHPAPPMNAPMTAAEFIYREDGRPDWGQMWQSFCELALYGGPPHRGPDDPVLAPVVDEAAMPEFEGSDAVAEIRRGIWETTGLYSEPAPPSWLAVTCESKRMAAWMAASIILENVDAKCDEERLYVPAGTDFELRNQIKSVITVVAKVHHYWQAHVAASEYAQA